MFKFIELIFACSIIICLYFLFANMFKMTFGDRDPEAMCTMPWHHKWGKWSDPWKRTVTYGHGGQSVYLVQEKFCTVCNAKRERVVKGG